MVIEVKIILTLFILFIVTYFAAYPTTKFANWGESYFKEYTTFLVAITAFYFIPMLFIIVYAIWKY